MREIGLCVLIRKGLTPQTSSTMSDETQPNALGLEFAQSPSHEEGDTSTAASPTIGAAEMARRRERPYHNPERHKTGGERVCQIFRFFLPFCSHILYFLLWHLLGKINW